MGAQNNSRVKVPKPNLYNGNIVDIVIHVFMGVSRNATREGLHKYNHILINVKILHQIFVL